MGLLRSHHGRPLQSSYHDNTRATGCHPRCLVLQLPDGPHGDFQHRDAISFFRGFELPRDSPTYPILPIPSRRIAASAVWPSASARGGSAVVNRRTRPPKLFTRRGSSDSRRSCLREVRVGCLCYTQIRAGLAELTDALDLKSGGRKAAMVRFLYPAPKSTENPRFLSLPVVAKSVVSLQFRDQNAILCNRK